MSSQSNQSPELKDPFAEITAKLHELLERGEISREAFALYSAIADAETDLRKSPGQSG
jgi:hypothetical protein